MINNRHLTTLAALVVIIPVVLLLMLFSASAGLAAVHAISTTVQEYPLDPGGYAYEVNPDTHGNLWVSDDGANQVLQFHPATGVVTTYAGLDNATDARRDAAGMVWWSNAAGTDLVRLSPDTGALTTWTLPGTGYLWGTTFDDAGRVWTTDSVYGVIYRFTPGTAEVCTYQMPDAGASTYMVAQGADIWLSDGTNQRILKLDPTANLFTIWELSGGAFPKGMAIEANGNLWWADEGLSRLGRLEPGINRLTAYPLPVGTTPEMIAFSQGKAWYTELVSRTVGMLDPAVAAGSSSTLVRTTAPVTPACSNLGAGTGSSVSSSKQAMVGTPTAYTQLVNSGGWTVYQMPQVSYPWGIAAGSEEAWIVDQGHQKLAHLVDVRPDITVTKTASPTSVPETGGNVLFTFKVTNNSVEAATITALSDNKFGTLAGDADCHVGAVLAAGASCEFSTTFAIPAGGSSSSHVNTFSAMVTDADGFTDTATDDETISYVASSKIHLPLVLR
jgi:streptogramin lyase